MECSSRGGAVRVVKSVISIAGDGLIGVAECALLGTWLDIARNEAIALEM